MFVHSGRMASGGSGTLTQDQAAISQGWCQAQEDISSGRHRRGAGPSVGHINAGRSHIPRGKGWGGAHKCRAGPSAGQFVPGAGPSAGVLWRGGHFCRVLARRGNLYPGRARTRGVLCAGYNQGGVNQPPGQFPLGLYSTRGFIYGGSLPPGEFIRGSDPTPAVHKSTFHNYSWSHCC